jgi:phosphatidylglycerophosphatase A
MPANATKSRGGATGELATTQPGAVERRTRLGPAVWLASGLGLGFLPWVPGTWGSLWGLPLAWGVGRLPWPAALTVACAVWLMGVPLCALAARRLGRKDPGAVVWDEIAAFPVVFFLVDLTRPLPQLWPTLAAGFVLFRVFDILKPPPIRSLERLPGGWGIMVDDVAAAAYARVALHVLVWMGVL